MDFRVLGPIEVLAEGEPLRLGGPRQQAMLAYLVLRSGELVQASRLLDELWHTPPAGGAAAVHTNVSRLRRVVGDRIATVGTGYALRLEESDVVDLAQFQELLAEAGTAEDPAERARLLRAADALWRGTPFDGLDVPFAATEVLALEELRLSAIEERIEAELDAGRNGDLVAELAALVARHPLRERLREHWIVALYRSGRQAEALEAHRETRRMFDDELGLELSPALAALERAILQHDPSLDRKPLAHPAAERVRPRWRFAVVGAVALGLAAVAAGLAAAVVLTRGDRPSAIVEILSLTRTVRTHEAAVVAKTATTRRPRRPRPRHHTSLVVAKPGTTTATVAAPPTVSTRATARTRTSTAAPPVTTTHATTTTHVVKTTPVRPLPTPALSTISDTFEGTAIDAATWYQIGDGTGWTMAEHSGHLEFSFQPGTASDPRDGVYGGHVGTQCNFPGDFDARVDYALVQWPSPNGMSLGLVAFLGPKPTGWAATRTAYGPDQYQGYVAGKYKSVDSGDWSGTLRVARASGVVTAYFLRNGSWVSLGSARDQDVASIGLIVLGGESRSAPFNGQSVVVDFDNFHLTAAGARCPPG
ncbi:MAG: BTAD domain-containing putative transcriptional regulator [Gaiellaceae bacterium]